METYVVELPFRLRGVPLVVGNPIEMDRRDAIKPAPPPPAEPKTRKSKESA